MLFHSNLTHVFQQPIVIKGSSHHVVMYNRSSLIAKLTEQIEECIWHNAVGVGKESFTRNPGTLWQPFSIKLFEINTMSFCQIT